MKLPASAASADITGTWEVTIHYPPPDGDYQATYVLKQDGEKISGAYHGVYGPADVTGTIKSDNVVLSVTVHGSRFSGKVSLATQMSGTGTGFARSLTVWMRYPHSLPFRTPDCILPLGIPQSDRVRPHVHSSGVFEELINGPASP